MIKKIAYTLPVILSLAVYSAPEAFAESRFRSMDKNGDNLVDFEEFKNANPNFSPVAFEIVDTNKDGKVTSQEWVIFLEKHSRPEGLRMEAEQITRMPAKTAPDSPQVGTPQVVNPTPPQIINTKDNLPILTAPSPVTTPSMSNPSTPSMNAPTTPKSPQMTSPKVEMPNTPAALNVEKSSQIPLSIGNSDSGIKTLEETAEERPVADIPVDSEGNADIKTLEETAEERPVADIPVDNDSNQKIITSENIIVEKNQHSVIITLKKNLAEVLYDIAEEYEVVISESFIIKENADFIVITFKKNLEPLQQVDNINTFEENI